MPDSSSAVAQSAAGSVAGAVKEEQTHAPADPDIHVALTHSLLDPSSVLGFLSSPSAGANVLFSGTTRNTFDSRPVIRLSYTAYESRALKTMRSICAAAKDTHGLVKVALVHRLGDVPVGESSVLVGVSAGHRGAAWRGAEEVLERCKEKVEVWKWEEFADGGGTWKANRDGTVG